jgi:hypothetical protein
MAERISVIRTHANERHLPRISSALYQKLTDPKYKFQATTIEEMKKMLVARKTTK